MIKATFIAVALAAASVSSEAQVTPAPAPVLPPASPEIKPAQPARTPKANRPPLLPKVWGSDDLIDLQDRLDVLRDIDFDLVMPPIPPIAAMEPMGAMS